VPDTPNAIEPQQVLCVDDDAANRMLVARALARGGRFTVETAATGRECLDRARALRPAVILLDWMLPDMSGGEVVAALAADPVTADIPVVVLSGLDRAATDPAAGDAPLRFVGKPYRLDELFAVVEDAADDQA
jgi:CheY-like chemotaxis protein